MLVTAALTPETFQKVAGSRNFALASTAIRKGKCYEVDQLETFAGRKRTERS